MGFVVKTTVLDMRIVCCDWCGCTNDVLTNQSQIARRIVTSQSCCRRRDLSRRMMRYVVQTTLNNVDVLKHQSSNKIIRNVLCSVYFTAASFFGLLYLKTIGTKR